MRLVSELRRRNVLRMAALYAIAAWLIVQVAGVLIDLAKLPDWIGTTTLWVLIIGFPIALIFSWFYEITPEGIGLEKDADPDVVLTHGSDRRLDFLVISLLCAAVILFAFDKWGSSDPPDRSVAVLPFADMSPNGDQEYFGDGIAEELLNELARLDGLRVASRTSSFSFKGTNENLGAIAEALNVGAILEGSVRKDGDRVRITAQLINASDGYHLWSETYDRELVDVFAIQEEIATSVSGALGVRLGVGGVNAFKGAGTKNIEAYEAYLKGMGGTRDERIRLLERAIELDPNYAAAWSMLALRALATGWNVYPGENDENMERAYALTLRAVELDPESAQSLRQLGLLLHVRGDWIGGEEAYLKALSLLPDSSSLTEYGHFLMRAGRSAAALEQYEKSEAVAPSRGLRYFRLPVALAQGRFADARAVFAIGGTWSPLHGADLTIALHEGDTEEIKAIMAAKPPTAISTIKLYAPVLKVFDSHEMVLSTLRAAYADNGSRWPSKLHDIALLAAYFGDPELALQTIGEEVRLHSPRIYALWYPLMSEVRQLQGFKELVTDLNLVASGWADLCQPLGEDDFECI